MPGDRGIPGLAGHQEDDGFGRLVVDVVAADVGEGGKQLHTGFVVLQRVLPLERLTPLYGPDRAGKTRVVVVRYLILSRVLAVCERVIEIEGRKVSGGIPGFRLVFGFEEEPEKRLRFNFGR